MPDNSESDQRHREFVRLFSQHSRAVYTYILTLVLNHSDADDLFQDTSVVLWEKFAEFQPDSDFRAWACRTAQFEVYNFRRKRSRQPFLSLSTLELLADDALTMQADLDRRDLALVDCLQALDEEQLDLIRRRYHRDQRPQQIADDLGRSVHSVYRRLNRIHDRLYRCIERRLAQESHQ